MKMTEELRNDVLILRFEESRLDASRAPALREELIRQVEAGHDRIVLDLSATEFMDSSGLGALVSCIKRMGARGTLAVAGAQGAVARLFALTRMDRVFALHPTTDAALAQLSG
jgi:anti-sigma B factor antagonist